MPACVYVNGQISSARDAVVSVLDHGFLYGEGVYEVVRTYEGRLFLFDEHVQRLRASAGRIALAVPFSGAELEARISETIAALERQGRGADESPETYVRVLLTRGVGGITYDPDACPSPTLVIIAKPLNAPDERLYREGVSVALAPMIRNHPAAVSPAIKSNNLLNNAMAAQHALRRGAFEAVFRNYRGELAEGALSNLFIVSVGRIATPPIDAGLLPGITRAFVLSLCRERGWDVREETLHERDLVEADEAFLTGTTIEVLPVVRVDDRVIGAGRPGPRTRDLHAYFRERVR